MKTNRIGFLNQLSIRTLTPLFGMLTAAAPALAGGGVTHDQVVAAIESKVYDSSCSKETWGRQGSAPTNYLRGMAVSYAKQVCNFKFDPHFSTVLISQPMTETPTTDQSKIEKLKDAVARLWTKMRALPANFASANASVVRAVFTMGIGFGMKESGGYVCRSWDRKAGSSRKGSEFEAGLFQISYDVVRANPSLQSVYNE